MLYHERIDVSEVTDVDKTSASKKCIVCNYWYFSHKGLRFLPAVSGGCHDVLKISIDTNNIAILNIHSVGYCCIIDGISISEAIKKWIIIKYNFFITYK